MPNWLKISIAGLGLDYNLWFLGKVVMFGSFSFLSFVEVSYSIKLHWLTCQNNAMCWSVIVINIYDLWRKQSLWLNFYMSLFCNSCKKYLHSEFGHMPAFWGLLLGCSSAFVSLAHWKLFFSLEFKAWFIK